MSDFRPALNNRLVIKVSQNLVLPSILWWNQYESIEIEESLVETLATLKGKRTIICSNHSHRHDPLMLFLLSAVLDQEFNYVAAREIFDWWKGFCGWGLQRHGVYSIRRGALDRQSMSMTRKLIVEGQRKLVVFPECEISGRNDRLLPVERGLSSLLLHAADDVHKALPGETVYVLPLALNYRYCQDVTASLSNAMLRLEKQLGIAAFASDMPGRLMRICKRLLVSIEAQFNLTPGDFNGAASVTDSVEKLLRYCSHCLDYSLPPSIDPVEAARLLRVHLDTIMNIADKNMPPYQRQLHRQLIASNRQFYRLLETVRRLLALQDFLGLKDLSPENLAGGIELIEREVFGRVTQKGVRTVRISCGAPINLAERQGFFKQNKRAAADQLAGDIECELSELLGLKPLQPDIAA